MFLGCFDLDGRTKKNCVYDTNQFNYKFWLSAKSETNIEKLKCLITYFESY